MNALSWVGIGLMVFGAMWAFLMWWVEVRRPPQDQIPKLGRPRKLNPIVELINAIAGLLRATADLLKIHYGAPALVFVGGLVVLLIGQVSA